jgi:competence protein ComEC
MAGLMLARRRPAVAIVAILVLFVGLAGLHRSALWGGPLDQLARHGGVATVEGTVVREPAFTDGDRWWTIVRVWSIDGAPTRERATLRGDGDPPSLGSTLAVQASASPLDDDTGFGGYLRRQHVVASIDPIGAIDVRAGPGRLLASTEHVRTRVRQAAAQGLEGDRAGLAVGLVIGDTRLLDRATQERMREVGLTHLVAVSGTNVALVAGGVWLVCLGLGVGARGRRLLAALTIAWFVVLTRAAPSVLRAATMAGAVLIADARGTGRQAVHALSVAVLVLLAVDPALAGSLGLALSASATAGILVLAPRVATRLRRLPRPVASLVAVSIGAQVATAPVLLVTFGQVPLTSVPANLVAVPAATLARMIGAVGTLVAAVDVTAASWVLRLADPALRVVLAAARMPDLPVVSLARPGVLVVTAGIVVWVAARRGGAPARVGVATGALGLALLAPVPRPDPVTLAVTVIDVGQGDAILVQGGGARILVDGGPDPTEVADWLQRRGIRHLDLVVQTHPHLDHTAGLPAVVQRLRVEAVWLRHVPTSTPYEQDLRDAAAERGVTVVEPVAGQAARVGGLVVHVLSPPPGLPFAGSESEVNEMSLVLRVDQGQRRALLPGDAERDAQWRMLAAPDSLRAGALAVPHHGSATSVDEFFLAVAAQVGTISAGRNNRHGHPHPATLAALAMPPGPRSDERIWRARSG